MKKLILSSLVVLGLSSAAYAQAATDFTTLDADASGGLSLTEVQTVFADLQAESFAAADVDGSGELSAEEYAAATTAPAPAQ